MNKFISIFIFLIVGTIFATQLTESEYNEHMRQFNSEVEKVIYNFKNWSVQEKQGIQILPEGYSIIKEKIGEKNNSFHKNYGLGLYLDLNFMQYPYQYPSFAALIKHHQNTQE